MGNTGRILIVDDEPNVRLVFRTTLESAGYTVFEAADGETALGFSNASPFDLVLLDLKMPGIGGMEMLRRLRDAGHDVPVVIVTAHGSIPDAVQAMKLGAIDFLSKPLTPDGAPQGGRRRGPTARRGAGRPSPSRSRPLRRPRRRHGRAARRRPDRWPSGR